MSGTSDFVLALDQGTTSSRAMLFDREGRVRAVAQKEFEQRFPQPGWVEHDPLDIWSSQSGVAAEVLERVGARAADVAAVGIANQRETTLLWDRSNLRPIANAIVWQDRRTAPDIERLRAEGALDLVRQRTGLLLDPYFSASKIAWLLDHVPGARERAEAGELAFGTVDSWLLARLTDGAVHATDVSNASRTLLFDLHRLDWSDELLALFRVPRAVMPEVRPSSAVVAEVAHGPLAGVPIAGVAGDQQAATFGQVCFAAGQAKNTYGTGCFLVMHTGDRPRASHHDLLSTVAWQVGDERAEYAMEGSIFVAGAVVQWLRDGLGIVREAKDIEALAASVPDSAGLSFVPAFTGLGAPHWDPYARGTIVGLTRGATAAHVARAALEGIALQVADVVDAMKHDAGLALTELRVDGGASRNDLLMQIQADLLNVPVVRPEITETTALGAAYLAGLAVGLWADRDALTRQWRAERTFEPIPAGVAAAEALRERWRGAVERAKGWESAGGS